jgi:hypothetical protein
MSINSYMRQPLPQPLLYGRMALSMSIASRYDLELFDPPLDYLAYLTSDSRSHTEPATCLAGDV